MTCDGSSQFFRTVEESGLLVPGKKEILELNGEGGKTNKRSIIVLTNNTPPTSHVLFVENVVRCYFSD